MGDGFFYPFFALYLASRGFDASKIGFLLSISPLLAVLLNPIYSRICKDVNRTKFCLGAVTVMEGIAIILIAYTSTYHLMIALVILMAIFGCCHYGLLDALTAVYCDNNEINYSGIRAYGSFAYIIATAVGGNIAQYVSYQATFIIAMILFALSGIVYFSLKRIDVNKEENEKIRIIDALKNGRFVFFALLYCLLLGTMTSTDYFLSTYLESRGLEISKYGYVFSYFVGVEVILLIVFSKLGRKISFNLLMIMGTLSLLIRLMVNYFYLPLPYVIALSGLRGVTYACILHVAYQNVVDIVGENKATLAIMIMTLMYAIYVFAFNNVNGNIIEVYSYKTFYLINVVITFLVLCLSFLLFKKPKIKE